MPINKGMMSSNTAEWATPQELFDELDAEFHFTLDPCATKENAKCAKFFRTLITLANKNQRGEEVTRLVRVRG